MTDDATTPVPAPPCSPEAPCPGPEPTRAHIADYGECYHLTDWSPVTPILTFRNAVAAAEVAPVKPTAAALYGENDVLPWERFRADGLLWYVNRVCFHPWGLALGMTAAGWRLVPAPDGAPWTYGPDVDEGALLARLRETFAAAAEGARQ